MALSPLQQLIKAREAAKAGAPTAATTTTASAPATDASVATAPTSSTPAQAPSEPEAATSTPASSTEPAQQSTAAETAVNEQATPDAADGSASVPANALAAFGAAPAKDEKNLPIHIRTEEEAKNALATLFGPSALTTSRSLADVADVDGSGMRLAWPFAQIRKGNWLVHKSCPEAIKEFMPVGGDGIMFNAVYIAHRVGVTIWQGDPQDGNPPVGAYVLPSARVTDPPELANEILRETMRIASRIQFTKGSDRDRYFPEGKLTPEVHVLVWTPRTGFILLVAPGYSPVQDTLDHFAGEIETNKALWPLAFSIKKHSTINKNAQPGDKNYKWDHFSILPSVAMNTKIQELANAWATYRSNNLSEVMNKATQFLKGEDHEGKTLEEIAELLGVYSQRVAALPQRNRR